MDAVQRLQHANREIACELQSMEEFFNDTMIKYDKASPEQRQKATEVYNTTRDKAKRRIEINTRMIRQFQRGAESYVDGSTNVTTDATADVTR